MKIDVDIFGEEWKQTWGKELSPFQARILAAMSESQKQFFPGQTDKDRQWCLLLFRKLRKEAGSLVSKIVSSGQSYSNQHSLSPPLNSERVRKILQHLESAGTVKIIYGTGSDPWRNAICYLPEDAPEENDG